MKNRLITFVLLFTLALNAVYVFAQETHTVTFDDFSFSFNLAENVEIQQYAGDPVEGAGPGFTDAARVQFTLFNILPDPVNGPAFPFEQVMGGIRFYKLDDLAQYTFMQEQVDALRTLVADNADLMPYTEVFEDSLGTPLPFLPIYPHGQNFRAQPKYVETDTLEGIAYITAFAATAEPFVTNSFTYTFQGLTKDGQYYVSATFNPTTSLFLEQLEGFDPATFNWMEYMTEAVATLNGAAPTDFTPSLDTLDAIVSSIEIAQ
jgi:hypothetical protein